MSQVDEDKEWCNELGNRVEYRIYEQGINAFTLISKLTLAWARGIVANMRLLRKSFKFKRNSETPLFDYPMGLSPLREL